MRDLHAFGGHGHIATGDGGASTSVGELTGAHAESMDVGAGEGSDSVLGILGDADRRDTFLDAFECRGDGNGLAFTTRGPFLGTLASQGLGGSLDSLNGTLEGALLAFEDIKKQILGDGLPLGDQQDPLALSANLLEHALSGTNGLVDSISRQAGTSPGLGGLLDRSGCSGPQFVGNSGGVKVNSLHLDFLRLLRFGHDERMC